MNNNSTEGVLRIQLEKLGAREFEMVALTMEPKRGLAALHYALSKGAEHPIAYAVKMFDNAEWQPSAGKVRHDVNRSVDVECATCGGDRFVVVNTRKPKQSALMQEQGIVPRDGWETKEGWVENVIEEMAPCPQCGPKL